MAVAVRCTGCRGASQVGVDALGMLVMCPMCHEPFLALEEAAPVVRPSVRPPRQAPAAPQRNRPHTLAEPVRDHSLGETQGSPLPANGGLPVSVLFGFALLPLAIPLIWLIGPQLLSKPPALTLAAPISLAVAASVLCLAVVLTIDWTPMTRIKGVLILVGLSYFAGLSLYFLKREVVERVKDFFTPNVTRWEPFVEPGNKAYTVNMPKRPVADAKLRPLGKAWTLACHKCVTDAFPGPVLTYVVGSGPDLKLGADDRWFDQVEQALLEPPLPPGTKHDPRASLKLIQGFDAKRWVFEFPEGGVRVVMVFRTGGVVYYLSVEGEGLEADSPAVTKFFDSFHVGPLPGK